MRKIALNIILDLIFILGISFLIVAILIKIFFDKKSKVCTQIVDASIVDIRKIERTESGTTEPQYVSYFPVYEYKYMGRIYKSGSNVGNLKSAFEIGKKVKIYIDPQNPEKIYEASNVPKLLIGIFVAVGMILILISVLIKVLAF